MTTFRLRGTTIIKLTATYSLIVGILGVYNSVNTFISTAKTTQPLGLFGLLFSLLIISPFLAHALVLYKSWRGARRSTIILYGLFIFFIVFPKMVNGFDYFEVITLIRFIIYCVIVFVFITNKEVKAALNSSGSVTLKQKRLAELQKTSTNPDFQDTPPDTSTT